MLYLKVLFGISFIATIVLGYIGLKRFDEWFGPDPNAATDNDSTALLNKSQYIMVWIMGIILCGMMIFIL